MRVVVSQADGCDVGRARNLAGGQQHGRLLLRRHVRAARAGPAAAGPARYPPSPPFCPFTHSNEFIFLTFIFFNRGDRSSI